MKLDSDISYLLLNIRGPNTVKIMQFMHKNSFYEKLLDINFNYKLNFEKHRGSLQKFIKKVNALARLYYTWVY